MGGAADRAGEGCRVDRGELEAGGDAGVQRRDVGVDHRVGEAAGAGDDRHAAVAQAVELGQAAGLEARRDEDGVAAALHRVRERLVVADDDADPAGILGGERQEGRLEPGVAAAEHREPVAGADDVGGGDPGEQVDALLEVRRLIRTNSGEPSACEAEALLDGGAVGGAALQAGGAENGAASSGSVSGFQTSVSMPLTMPCSTPARAEIRPWSPMPYSGVLISSA